MRRDTLYRYEQTLRQPHLPLPLVPQIGSVARRRMANVFKRCVPRQRTAAFGIPIIFGSSQNILLFLRDAADL
jgi:hypothetical protein